MEMRQSFSQTLVVKDMKKTSLSVEKMDMVLSHALVAMLLESYVETVSQIFSAIIIVI